jgi:beta-glucanase (GH16 family)
MTTGEDRLSHGRNQRSRPLNRSRSGPIWGLQAGLAVILLLSCLTALQADPRPGDWNLVWSDEFACGSTETAPNPANWGYEIGYVRNKEWQYYTNELKNAYCQNGSLHIEAHKDSPGTYPVGSYAGQDGSISSASLISKGLVARKYGWLEMRARIDTGWGSWPAFWTLGVNGDWPDCGEADIMEYYQGKLLFNTAWWKKGDRRWTARWDSVTENLSALPAGWADAFHIWAMEWTATEVRLYLDGFLYNTWDPSLDSGDGSIQGFQQPHYIILNQAIGGTAGGDASGLSYPTHYEIDWVRWYEDSTQYVDDNSASVTYAGKWGTWSGNPGLNKTEHFSTTPGAAATFTFTGTKVWYYGHVREDLGMAEIFLDGQSVGTVDCFSSEPNYFVALYESGAIEPGQHTLQVRVTGAKNAASSGAEIIIDGFGYVGAAAPVDHYPFAETTTNGTVKGSLADLKASDNAYEAITEVLSGGNANNRYSLVKHTWKIDIGTGGSPALHVEAYRGANSDGDDFVFAYSTDNINYNDTVTVKKAADDNGAQVAALPANLSGTIYVRVTDVNRTRGKSSLDTIYIDQLFIRTTK